MEDIKIYNNVAYKAGQGNNNVIAAIMIDSAATNTFAVNNIVAFSSKTGVKLWNVPAVSSPTTVLLSNNLFYQNKINGILGANPILADPQFSSPPISLTSPASFQLQPASPAINRGLDMGLAKFGIGQDIGAYEYGLATWAALGPAKRLQLPIAAESERIGARIGASISYPLK